MFGGKPFAEIRARANKSYFLRALLPGPVYGGRLMTLRCHVSISG